MLKLIKFSYIPAVMIFERVQQTHEYELIGMDPSISVDEELTYFYTDYVKTKDFVYFGHTGVKCGMKHRRSKCGDIMPHVYGSLKHHTNHFYLGNNYIDEPENYMDILYSIYSLVDTTPVLKSTTVGALRLLKFNKSLHGKTTYLVTGIATTNDELLLSNAVIDATPVSDVEFRQVNVGINFLDDTVMFPVMVTEGNNASFITIELDEDNRMLEIPAILINEDDDFVVSVIDSDRVSDDLFSFIGYRSERGRGRDSVRMRSLRSRRYGGRGRNVY